MTKTTAWEPRRPLPTRLAEELRARITQSEWQPGDRLPTEAEFVREYSVSRATVRQALTMLEAQGLVRIHHGRGTYVAAGAVIRAGMQELKATTTLVAEMGYVPSVQYHHRKLRTATQEEADAFDLPAAAKVLDIQVRILADGLTVAYSYDVLPRWVFPDDFRPTNLTGSVVAYLEAHDRPVPTRAVAQVHAVSDPAVAWDKKVPEDQLFVLLDQMHFDKSNRPVMHSRSYFIEGQFNFTVVRRSGLTARGQ